MTVGIAVLAAGAAVLAPLVAGAAWVSIVLAFDGAALALAVLVMEAQHNAGVLVASTARRGPGSVVVLVSGLVIAVAGCCGMVLHLRRGKAAISN